MLVITRGQFGTVSASGGFCVQGHHYGSLVQVKFDTRFRDFVNTRLLIHKHAKISVDEWIIVEWSGFPKSLVHLDQIS